MTDSKGSSKFKKVFQKDLKELFTDRLKKNNISDDKIKQIKLKIDELGEFIPTVGIFGKTGVGKSSLCNALFGKETAKVDATNSMTRVAQEIFINMNETGAGIRLIDLPGVGENQLRDTEYAELYREWLPKLDLVIWLIRADDRTFSVDEFFYNSVIKPSIEPTQTPFLVVINQVDKINPIREWDETNRRPGHNQMKIIGERTQWASDKFCVQSNQVVAVSAEEKYNLGTLVESIIDIVPNEKKLGFLNQMDEEFINEQAQEKASKGVLEYIRNIYDEIKPYIPEIIAAIKWIVNEFKKK